MLGEMGVDSTLQFDDRAEDATTDALARHFGKEVLNRIEPGGRHWGEVARRDPLRRFPPRRERCPPVPHASAVGCGHPQSLATVSRPQR